jgi:DNA-directed RNA polymerase subunit F
MILNREPLNIYELKEKLENTEDSEKKTKIEDYLKKFSKTKPVNAQKIEKELIALDILKLKKEHIVKIIDLMPEDASDLNKIFTDISLNEDETNKILEVIKDNK